MDKQTRPSRPGNHVCPWWLAYSFDNPIRKLFHRPEKILAPYILAGSTAMDVGCGMGVFSIGLAHLVGEGGRIFAVDLQQKMLDITMKRAGRAGIADKISPHLCQPNDLNINAKVDFILTFWMAHEVPDQKQFFSQLHLNANPAAKLLVAEPKMHVSSRTFQKTVKTAESAGFVFQEQPRIRFSHAALLTQSDPQR